MAVNGGLLCTAQFTASPSSPSLESKAGIYWPIKICWNLSSSIHPETSSEKMAGSQGLDSERPSHSRDGQTLFSVCTVRCYKSLLICCAEFIPWSLSFKFGNIWAPQKMFPRQCCCGGQEHDCMSVTFPCDISDE